MIELQLVLTGIAIGVAVAAPIGPVNILCIQRSLKQGFAAGLLTGMGAVLGDGMFAAIAAFSITSISGFLTGYSYWIEIIGGMFLLALGLRTLVTETTIETCGENVSIIDNTALVGTTFFMTITNPAMVLGFAAFFGSAGGLIQFPENYSQATVLVVAVMAGSFLWWLFLAGTMHRFRSKIGSNTIAMINRVSGAIILLFGAAVLLRVIIAEYGQS
jgi:threonine/homoserine/homoserine lactone efflux protein